jgi:hypothetical protein
MTAGYKCTVTLTLWLEGFSVEHAAITARSHADRAEGGASLKNLPQINSLNPLTGPV